MLLLIHINLNHCTNLFQLLICFLFTHGIIFIVYLFCLYRETDQTTLYFVQQRRKGHGNSKKLVTFVVETIDIFSGSKPAPYRILHQAPSAESYYGNNWQYITTFSYIYYLLWTSVDSFTLLITIIAVIACSLTQDEIENDWKWLLENVCPTLHSIESEDEIRKFVCGKIQSIIAISQNSVTEGILNCIPLII